MDINSVLDAAIENVLLKRSLLKQVRSEQGSLFDMLEKYIALSEGVGVIPVVLSENDVADLFKFSTDQEFHIAEKHEIIVEGGANTPVDKDIKKLITKSGKKSQEQVAHDLNLDPSTVSRYAHNRRKAAPEIAAKLAPSATVKQFYGTKPARKDSSTKGKAPYKR